MSGSEQMRVGLVGLGRWGRNIARTIRQEVPGLSLTAAASSAADAQEIAGLKAQIFSDWRNMFQAATLDGVLLATPARLHAEIASEAISAGLPVFVEKPMALTVADAEALAAHGRDKSAIAKVDHVDLHNPAITEIKSRLTRPPLRISGRIGAAYERRADIAPLWEYSPHFIAVAMDLMGAAPVSVAATRMPRETAPFDDPSKEIIRLTLGFASGAEAVIEAGNGMADKTRFLDVEIEGAVYSFVDRAAAPLSIVIQNAEPVAIAVEPTKPLTAAIRDFETAIRKGASDCKGLEIGLSVIRVLDAADRALAKGAPVLLSEEIAA